MPRRLTFSVEDDRDPAWAPSGDTVYYHTKGIPPFLETEGLLLRIPAEGGEAGPLLPAIQFPGAPRPWLTAPVPGPDGALAYTEMWSVGDGQLCLGTGSTFCTPESTDPTAPRLREVRVRVRDLDSVDPIAADPLLSVRFEGITELPPLPPAPPRFEVEFHPFHRLFNTEKSRIFGPSWRPDGSRLVTSDGLRLLIWDPVTDEISAIPGTDDGIQPAWSPDGQWIAFTQLERGDPVLGRCAHLTAFGTACDQRRTEWPVAGRFITLVRPDGSELRRLGPGDEPAWTPDGDALVFRIDGALSITPAEAYAPVVIEHTESGRDPAVSPDARTLAFAKVGDNGSFDIWVTGLPSR